MYSTYKRTSYCGSCSSCVPFVADVVLIINLDIIHILLFQRGIQVYLTAHTLEALSETGEIADKNCVLILKSIVLKVLLKFSDVVKADQDYHDAYERVLNALIKCNDESATVILDEYRTH